MAERPAPPDVDRVAASRAAVAARRSRAEVKQEIACGRRTALSVFEQAGREASSPAASLRVPDFLRAIPGIGVTKTATILQQLGISKVKRLGGLGTHQRERLQRFLSQKEGGIVAAGRTNPTPVSTRSAALTGSSTLLASTTADEAATSRSTAPHASGARLVVLAGPTAVGKGTVSRYIREHHPEVLLSVSATTRAPRPGEVDGEHYFFVDDAEFDQMLAEGELLEHATVFGAHRYGTPRRAVERALAAGRSVLLEIDLQGARQVKAAEPDAFLIFLAPPSWDELVRRLLSRGTEGADEQQRRLATAKVELAAQNEFDRVVVNDRVELAAAKVVELMSTNS